MHEANVMLIREVVKYYDPVPCESREGFSNLPFARRRLEIRDLPP